MKHNNIFHNYKLLFLFIILLGFGLSGPVHAQTADTNKEPIIKTEKTPYGNSVTITYPENYSGEVNTSFENGQWKTTTKQYTEEDMKKMQDAMKKKQEAFQKYFEAQQKFFNEIWGDSHKSPLFPGFPFFPMW